MADVLIIFHSADEVWRAKLEVQLLGCGVESWDCSRIEAGSDTELHIQQHLNTCKVAVLLVSADALINKEIQPQMNRLLERRIQGEPVYLIPMMARPAVFPAWAKEHEIRPVSRKALSLRKEEADQDLSDLAQEIRTWLVAGASKVPEITTIPTRVAYSPRDASLLCNRSSQRNSFRKVFYRGFEQNRNKPQFHLVHGKREDCPDSLVERLGRFDLVRCLNSLSDREPTALSQCQPKRIHLLLPGSEQETIDTFGLAQLYEQLIAELFDELFLNKLDDLQQHATDEWPQLFAEAVQTSGDLPLVITLEYHIQYWNEPTRELLARYQVFWQRFCDEVQEHSRRVQFLLFFYVYHPEKPPTNRILSFFRKTDTGAQLSQDFDKLKAELTQAGFLAHMVEPLTPVKLPDVEQWARECNYEQYLHMLKEKLLSKLFGIEQQLPMGRVAPQLAEFAEALSKEKL